MSRHPADKFAAWLDRNRIGVVILSALIAILGTYFAAQTTIKSDLTNLLPSSQRSVRDLVAVQARARPFGTINVVVEAADPAVRAQAAAGLIARFGKLDPDLVTQVSVDDGPLRRYGWQHRYLWAELKDLEDALAALDQRIEGAKLDANPLFISLDDDEPAAAGKSDRLAELEAKLADAEQQAKAPSPRVSKDGTLQLITLQTTFAGSDARRAKKLTTAIHRATDEVRAEVGRGFSVGLTGNITYSLLEHDSVLDGMTLALLLTIGLCAAAQLLYYRSGRLVLAMLYALGVGVVSTFALAWVVVGHLNVMTAFLFAIVVGNGINAALILVARYLEEVRNLGDPVQALHVAFRGAMRGTLAAAATAAIAYSSLLVTDFRGFRQFGAIAGAGMALTWVATFTVLPAILFIFARAGWINPTNPPAIGALLARMLPKRLGIVMWLGGALTAISLVISIKFIAEDPFTHDWRDLQSSSKGLLQARELDAKIRNALDTRSLLSGQAYQLLIAVDEREQVTPLVAKLRADDERRPPDQRWINDVRSMDDLVPPQQAEKLAVLAEITRRLDDPKLQAALTPEEKADLDRLRPPADLAPIGDAAVPHELGWPFIEKDGTAGRLIVIRGARRFNSFDVRDRLAFAREARAIELPPGAAIAGEALVVADIIETMERDAPPMTAFALGGSILAVFLVLGLRRHGLVTLACGMAGVVVMIAACALSGLRVHFLDLIALPITIGIGIDYAVNLAARDRQDGEKGPHHLLRTTGGSVLMCSYTTAVGYATLMLSSNGGIKAFGLAALLGEVACVTMGILVTPAWLALLRRRDGAKLP